MADQVEQPIVPAASAVAPEASPVIPVTPEPAAAVHPDQPAAATPKPDAAEASPAASGKVDPPAGETPKVEGGFKPTILDDLDKPKADVKAAEVKPAEVKPGEEAKPAEGEAKPAEVAPVELHKIDYFAAEGGVKLPDTLKLDDTSRTDLTAALDAFRADPTKGAQQIIDMGTKVIADAVLDYGRNQWKTWNDTQTDWQTKVMADPILGGSGHDTAMIAVGQGRNKLASTHKPGSEEFNQDLADFNEMARITGVGNHPTFLRMLHRAGKLFAEAAPPPPDPRPAPDNGRRPGGKREIYPNTKFPGQA